MPSHFSTIGFPVQDQDDLLSMADQVAEDAKVIEVPEGQYLRWSSECGAEVWLQLDREGQLIGIVPHFVGESRVRVGITSRIIRPDASPLDGAFHGWANPADEIDSGEYPFVFDLPDFLNQRSLRVPGIATFQIAAFAHEISIYDSLDAFNASQTGELKFAPQSFIPSGLFSPEGESTEPPDAVGIFTGFIIRAEQRFNDLTEKPFYWAIVDSLGGSFDVVLDPELVENEPQSGGVLQGSFWLTGRFHARD